MMFTNLLPRVSASIRDSYLRRKPQTHNYSQSLTQWTIENNMKLTEHKSDYIIVTRLQEDFASRLTLNNQYGDRKRVTPDYQCLPSGDMPDICGDMRGQDWVCHCRANTGCVTLGAKTGCVTAGPRLGVSLRGQDWVRQCGAKTGCVTEVRHNLTVQLCLNDQAHLV
jgi:hypothetical protein